MTDEQRAQMIYEIHQEREAYDNAVGLVSIAQILEIIDGVKSDSNKGYMFDMVDEIKNRILALKGGEQE